MRISRFFCPCPLTVSPSFVLPERAAHHAGRVLRLRVGDAIALFNGDGNDYAATITRATRDVVTAEITAVTPRDRESPLDVTLAQSVSSAERMDYTLQKAVELGVRRIQPLTTERSIVRLDKERAARKHAHWRNVVWSACEQCGRARVPEVSPTQPLGEWSDQLPDDALKLILSPLAERRLKDLSLSERPIVLLAGPEGGFSDNDLAIAARAGFTPVQLGPRILRTETAALAALAALQTLAGDF